MKVEQLNISFDYEGDNYEIHPTLIIQDEELTLVDTGYPGFMDKIEREIKRLNYNIENLKNIIITHYDDDHIGALKAFKDKYPNIQIISSFVEAKYIGGHAKSERLIQAENLLNEMSEDEKPYGEAFVDVLLELEHVDVDVEVTNGALILNNEVEVIATPGHTSGHISLYIQSVNSVITGDAAVKEGETLNVANPEYSMNLEDAENSLKKIKDLNAEKYYCFHGGLLEKA
ncbi:MBL fold metallo-hydrolase [Mammaliicoccus sciuri]|uniref:MBL fold metallo-hydrolase n=1 Tax=Mammaliicoccus sciuri TaxID=1296 RepID=UPI0019507A09|nr:MBL fold metallo-hydrolase [Mammaliicoccus sciuri]MCD8817655.1 MBL fold metallo-hydrolase [Mammaliicoccus sciuri]MCJ0967804.1 MBL fold metallo-hydrolase [Mammaliicoccus sciuri]MEB5649381.1 MBL fold metallo-hydrolase [Mammaliicoccus sciuri]MEB8132681.1 MBL fold metallo-hydrolase [Mammaliicoccus sciuri]